MARFFGKVGYADQVETRPSVWTDVITERELYGETDDMSWRYKSASDQVNNNLVLDRTFDLIVDRFAMDHYSTIRYICYGGARWEVTKLSYEYPRIHLTVGGIYHGPTPEDKCDSAKN